jgi:hypothetical protein
MSGPIVLIVKARVTMSVHAILTRTQAEGAFLVKD